MHFLPTLLVFTTFLTISGSADKCSICEAAVKGIKDGKGLGYLADLTAQQIEAYVKKNVEKHCSDVSVCAKLVEDLIEIADQLDDDLDSTPEELCQFQYYC